MEDHERRADELAEQADRLGEQTDSVQEHIDDVRSDLDAKLGDIQAPGLLEEDAAAPGGKGAANEDDE
jgi:chaperonin cofactor prefoldin